MTRVLSRTGLFTAALLSFGSCCSEPTDYFSDGTVCRIDEGGASHRCSLTSEEKALLNVYVAENTNCRNKSYVTYAPDGVTWQTPRVKICLMSHRVIISVKHGADGVWKQYVKDRDATDEVLLRLFE